MIKVTRDTKNSDKNQKSNINLPSGSCEDLRCKCNSVHCVSLAPDANDEIKMSSKLNAESIRRLGTYNGKWD